MKANYTEFSNPKLVNIYDTVNPIFSYRDFYLKLAKELEAKTVVDIGCGTGLLTFELSNNGFEVIGIEPSPEMLLKAKNRNYKSPVKFINGDAKKVIGLNVDMAIMTGHVAQFHLEDKYWQNCLISINNGLKPGGYLVFETRNPHVKPWFKDWPTSLDSAQVMTDPKLGNVKWWWNHLKTSGNIILYENHYFIEKTNEELVSINKLIFRSKDEIENNLKIAGFNIYEIYGDWDFTIYNDLSPEIIFVAQKTI